MLPPANHIYRWASLLCTEQNHLRDAERIIDESRKHVSSSPPHTILKHLPPYAYNGPPHRHDPHAPEWKAYELHAMQYHAKKHGHQVR
jgi:hypothetical protein